MCHSEYYFVGKCVCLFPCEFYFYNSDVKGENGLQVNCFFETDSLVPYVSDTQRAVIKHL